MIYNRKMIEMNIFIPEDEIDATDYIFLYNITDTTDDPSIEGSEGAFIARVASTQAVVDPSALGESYQFKYRHNVSESQTYDFEYVIFDYLGNIGSSNTFSQQACLVPVTPTISDPDFINKFATFTISQS